jgi:hypothetical protein
MNIYVLRTHEVKFSQFNHGKTVIPSACMVHSDQIAASLWPLHAMIAFR